MTDLPKLASDLSPDRTRMLSMIMLSLCEDSTERDDATCIYDRIGHLLKPEFEREVVIRALRESQLVDDGVDADIAVYVELQRLGCISV